MEENNVPWRTEEGVTRNRSWGFSPKRGGAGSNVFKQFGMPISSGKRMGRGWIRLAPKGKYFP